MSYQLSPDGTYYVSADGTHYVSLDGKSWSDGTSWYPIQEGQGQAQGQADSDNDDRMQLSDEEPFSLPTLYPDDLDPTSDRLQFFLINETSCLWHRSRSDCYIVLEEYTGEFHLVPEVGLPEDPSEGGTGEYYLQADLFEQVSLTFGDEFYLLLGKDGFYSPNLRVQSLDGLAKELATELAGEAIDPMDVDVNEIAGEIRAEIDEVVAIYVPWSHIMQHTYKHMSDFSIKDVHTFWPPDYTEGDVLGELVDALNAGDRMVKWEVEDSEIKTFFLDRARNPADFYTAEQMSDLGALFGEPG